jgi:hypothetical protein
MGGVRRRGKLPRNFTLIEAIEGIELKALAVGLTCGKMGLHLDHLASSRALPRLLSFLPVRFPLLCPESKLDGYAQPLQLPLCLCSGLIVTAFNSRLQTSEPPQWPVAKLSQASRCF